MHSIKVIPCIYKLFTGKIILISLSNVIHILVRNVSLSEWDAKRYTKEGMLALNDKSDGDNDKWIAQDISSYCKLCERRDNRTLTNYNFL
jgi:hypothetical protein